MGMVYSQSAPEAPIEDAEAFMRSSAEMSALLASCFSSPNTMQVSADCSVEQCLDVPDSKLIDFLDFTRIGTRFRFDIFRLRNISFAFTERCKHLVQHACKA